jgi:hypothetical protein
MTTQIVPEAVRQTSSDQRQQAQFASRWRMMSGAAKGYLWHHYGAAGTNFGHLDDDGIGEATIGGDIDRLISDYFTAFHVTARGWHLFAMRSGWPTLAST